MGQGDKMTAEDIIASRFFGTSREVILFLGALLLGAVLGAVYDILRALRMTFRHSYLAVFAEDFVFALLFGLAFYSYCTELTRGQLRFFVIAGMALGFAAYILTVGRITSGIAGAIVKFVKSVFMRLGKLLKKMVGILCGVPFFASEDEKMSEKPCTDGDG